MGNNNNLKLNITFLILFLLLLILAGSYLAYSWTRTNNDLSQKALLRAEIASIGLDGQMLRELKAQPEDDGTVAFESVKNRLERFSQLDENIQFVYLYTLKSGRLYFLVDSTDKRHPDYSSPGMEYTEADQVYKDVFFKKKAIITETVVDRWGSWISVLAPIVDKNTGEVFAVLGMDYPKDCWFNKALYSLYLDLIPVVLVLVLFLLIYRAFKQIDNRKKQFASLVENIPGVVFRCKLDKDWTMQFISAQIKELSGYPSAEFINNSVRSFTSIIYPEDRAMVEKEIKNAINKQESYSLEYRIKTANGEILWVSEKGRLIYDVFDKASFIEGVIFDISKEKDILTELKSKTEDLEQVNKFMINREQKMIEMKAEIAKLKTAKN